MMKNPFDETARNAVTDLCTSTLKTFATEYTKNYTLAVVNKIKSESEADEEPRRLLLSPTPPDVRKSGWLTKLGAVRKNWKKRWFVVDGNYRVAYYKKDKAGAKPQSSFSCFGYKVKSEKDKNEDEKKENTVILAPYWEDDVAKRVYQFTAATPEEYKDWTAMFTECCRNAGNPMHEDEVRREAFQSAYSAVRGRQPSSFSATGTEADMLAYHINSRADREVMRDVYSKVGTGFGSSTMKNKIRGMVAKIIAGAVDAGWKAASVAIDKIEDSVEDAIRKVVGPLFELQAKVMEKAKEGISSKLDPILEKLLKPLSEKVIPKIASPVAGFHANLYDAFCSRSEKKESAKGFWWTLDTSTFTALLDIVQEIAGVLNLSSSAFWDFRWKCRDEASELLERALYTATVESRESAAGKLLHDSRKVMEEALEWLVGAVVRPLIMDQLSPIIEAIVGPLSELIPESLQEFLDPVSSVEELAEHAIDSAIKGAIQFPEQKELFSIEEKFSCKIEMPSKDAVAQPVHPMSRQPSTEHRGSMFYVAPEEEKDSDDESEQVSVAAASGEGGEEEKKDEEAQPTA